MKPLALVKTLAGLGYAGAHDGDALKRARFSDPCGVVVDANKNVFVTDCGSHTVRCISAEGEVTTVAGCGKPGYADGKGNQAALSYPYALALGPDGTIYVADSGNHRIRKITAPADNRAGAEVATVAGTGAPGHRDGAAHTAQFLYPTGIAADSDGTLFVADRGNHRIRKITPKGTVTTLAGSGLNGALDGKGAQAAFAWPNAVCIDPTTKNAIFVVDTFVFQLRRVTRDGVTRTLCIGPKPKPKPKPEAPAAAPEAAPAAAPAADAAAPAAADAAAAPAAEAKEEPKEAAAGDAAAAAPAAEPAAAGEAAPAAAMEVDAPAAAAPAADGEAVKAEPPAAPAAADGDAAATGDAPKADAPAAPRRRPPQTPPRPPPPHPPPPRPAPHPPPRLRRRRRRRTTTSG